MLKYPLAAQLLRLVEALSSASNGGVRKTRSRRRPELEALEGRALMAGITAGAVVSSVADGPDFDYTVSLTNSSASTSGIGTFWYSWVPGKDFMSTSPVSVSPPVGWTDVITHDGTGDGYAIQFVASNSIYDVQPGNSLNFAFKSADFPASIGGNSTPFPGTPVGTSFVYPGAPFSDAGHEFVASVTPTPTPTPSPTPTPTPSPTPTPTSPVTITGIRLIENKRRMVTGIIVNFSGAVNASEAESVSRYKLATVGKKGSFNARNAVILKLKGPTYDAVAHAAMLTPRKAFALTKAVQLVVAGETPTGLQDSQGELIDGDHNGQPGGNAVAVLRRNGVTLS